MDYGFLKGIGISLFVITSYRIYVEQKIKHLEQNSKIQDLSFKISELESRIENLEDFKFRFYQIYTTSKGLQGVGVWNEWNDEDDSDLDSSDEEF